MKTHLSAQEFVDALEGTLADDRRAHAASCDACARQLTELTTIAQQSHEAGTVPEPSPLFWEHFSARVRTAVDAEPIRRLSWWERAWQPLAAVSAVTAAALLAVMVFNGRAPVTPAASQPVIEVAAVAIEPAVDDDSMEFMLQMASGASSDELQSARPGSDATSAAIVELTPEQQAEFIRLIKAEIGDQQ